MSRLVKNAAESRLAEKILSILAKSPLRFEETMDKANLPRRSRKGKAIVRALYLAGILTHRIGNKGVTLWAVARPPVPGELLPPDPPRFDVLTAPLEVGPLEVRGVEFEDGGQRVQIRMVKRYPSGAMFVRHLWGVAPEDARSLASALLDVADELEGAE